MRARPFLFAIALIASSPMSASSQTKYDQLDASLSRGVLANSLFGELGSGVFETSVIHPVTGKLTTYTVLYGPHSLLYLIDGEVHAWLPDEEPPPPGAPRVVDARIKSDDPYVALQLDEDGRVTVYRLSIGPSGFGWRRDSSYYIDLSASSTSPSWSKIVGDALYAQFDRDAIYVSRDTARTWTIDTTGLDGARIRDIDVDSNNVAWLATQSGLFTQHADSNVWRPDTSLAPPDNYCLSIFVDRRGRIFVGTLKSGSVYRSTNGGASWEQVGGFSDNALSFADDVHGNIYIRTGTAGYRGINGEAPWTRITDSLLAWATPNGITQPYGFFNSFRWLHVDSSLMALTSVGNFISTNLGDTWTYASPDRQLPFTTMYGHVRSGNHHLVTTRAGILRARTGDTSFARVFPQQGYIRSIPLSVDSAQRVFALARIPTSEFGSTAKNFVSTDNGATWYEDSLGLAAFGISIQTSYFYVDDQGTQYLGGNSSRLLTKRFGQPWKLDTAGLDLTGNSIRGVSYNTRKGFVYALKRVASTDYRLYRRGRSDSVWQALDASVFGATSLRLTSAADGDAIVHSSDGQIKALDGSTWKDIPLPAALTGQAFADIIIATPNSDLVVAFKRTSDFRPAGVYMMKDAVQSWTKFDLDGVDVEFFSLMGDTVIAGTHGSGLFRILTTGPATAVPIAREDLLPTYELHQNYPNPFNPATTIRYSLRDDRFVSLRVYDLLGREVARPFEGPAKAGDHEIAFDASALASGAYFYQLQAGTEVLWKRMVVLK